MHKVIGSVLICLIILFKICSGIKCYHCRDQFDSLDDEIPPCINRTSETNNIGILKECGEEGNVCYQILYRKDYVPPYESAVARPTGAAEKGCKPSSDGSDHLMRCFLTGPEKLHCFCKDQDGCNDSNGASSSFVRSYIGFIIVILFHLLRMEFESSQERK